MKRLNSTPQVVAQNSISSKMLMELGRMNADYVPIIMSAHKDVAPLTSFLVSKNKMTRGLNYSSSFFDENGNITGKYRAVGSNVLEYRIEKADIPIGLFKANADGETYIDDLNSADNIGKGKAGFWIFTDNNVSGYKDVIVLADGQTQLIIINDPEPSSNDTYKLFVKLVSGEYADVVNKNLLADGMEFQLLHTLHEQDFSERGNERYFAGAIGRTYLTLQRIKYSYSGTAAAIDKAKKVSGYFMEHGGVQSFITEADYQMTRIAAQFQENALLEGKTTVSQDLNKCVLTDERGRELLAGSGIMYSGDGAMRFPITSKGFTDQWFESFMSEIDPYVSTDNEGLREVVMICGSRLKMSFNSFLARKNKHVQVQNMVYKRGEQSGIIDTYNYYEFSGIRLVLLESDHFKNRAGIPLNDGSRSNEWMGYIIPTGNTPAGQQGQTICTLRPSVKGMVAGIDKGGNIASSVDGTHVHMLWQVGIISLNTPFIIERPWNPNTIYAFN